MWGDDPLPHFRVGMLFLQLVDNHRYAALANGWSSYLVLLQSYGDLTVFFLT